MAPLGKVEESEIYNKMFDNDPGLVYIKKYQKWIERYFKKGQDELPMSIWLKCVEEIHKINYHAEFIHAQIETA